MTIGDVNGDGKADLICSHDGTHSAILSNINEFLKIDADKPAIKNKKCKKEIKNLGNLQLNDCFDEVRYKYKAFAWSKNDSTQEFSCICCEEAEGGETDASSNIFISDKIGGKGKFLEPFNMTTGFCNEGTLLIGDINGDGKSDLFCQTSTIISDSEVGGFTNMAQHKVENTFQILFS